MSQTTQPACPGREETVHRYLDGDLSPAEQAEFTQHLQTCPACQHSLHEIQTVFDLLTTWPEETPPPEIPDRVMARLPHRRLQADLWPPVLAGQLLVGLTVLALAWPRWQARWSALLRQVDLPPALPHLPDLLALLRSPLPTLSIPQTWPTLPALPDALPRPPLLLAPETAILLAAAVLLVWLAGNLFLLKSRPLLQAAGAKPSPHRRSK